MKIVMIKKCEVDTNTFRQIYRIKKALTLTFERDQCEYEELVL
jgi:hypothetical protein